MCFDYLLSETFLILGIGHNIIKSAHWSSCKPVILVRF